MTDMESSLKNMILTLLTITLVASLAVGVVYRVTAGPIAEAKAAKITQAIAKVLPPVPQPARRFSTGLGD